MGRVKTNEEFEQRIRTINENISPLETYKGCKTKILFKCNICQYQWLKDPQHIHSNFNCPQCVRRMVYTKKGKNTIKSLKPHLVEYLVNADDAINYSINSTTNVKWKCINCGYICEKSIATVTKRGFICPCCNDGVSYPNKFSRALILQLPVSNVEFEYSPYWIGRFKYDSYFEYNGFKYIVEMDGGFHYSDNDMSDIPLTARQQRDDYKDTMAEKHNIKVIRVNCRYSTFEYIKAHILQSELSSIFDLSQINWLECDKMGTSNMNKMICEFYKEHYDWTFGMIAKHFKMCDITISRAIKTGSKFGWCDYSARKAKENRYRESSVKKYKSIRVYTTDNNYLYTFKSAVECSLRLEELTGKTYFRSNISTATKSGRPYKGFIFRKECEKIA